MFIVEGKCVLECESLTERRKGTPATNPNPVLDVEMERERCGRMVVVVVVVRNIR